jgi:hypothetical protein
MSSPEFLFFYSSSASSCFPFPASLQQLYLQTDTITLTLIPLSNLINLTRLIVDGSSSLRVEGLSSLVAQGSLTELFANGKNSFFNAEPSWPHEEACHSSKLRCLSTGDPVEVLTLPFCRVLSYSLTHLIFLLMKEVERFTEEQEEALHLLSSLQTLDFNHCDKLQRLPAGLTKLTNLKKLRIWLCPDIQLLPEDGLPSSLQELVIFGCPAIKSLPKDSRPSSLLKLKACCGISEELKSQCHKLKGTIPIIMDYNDGKF